MRELYQVEVEITYKYYIAIEKGQNPKEIAALCLDEAVNDYGRPEPTEFYSRKIEIPELNNIQERQGYAPVYHHNSTFEGMDIADYLEQHYEELEEQEPKIDPVKGQMELF